MFESSSIWVRICIFSFFRCLLC
ncbi:hypothetical protein Taro_016316 [Colocasia esculenta]|uniref:Uncharacterized protein n=1 Tax=Colocasia esculenta TaxID=4460 RepID=A0A843UDI4_COLES|nr:hypothetical protein [Colocasia esculenta]